jgi:hypothetical protein
MKEGTGMVNCYMSSTIQVMAKKCKARARRYVDVGGKCNGYPIVTARLSV